MSVLILCAPFSEVKFLAAAAGDMEVSKEAPEQCDSWIFLCIDCAVSVACLLPIRWSSLWLLNLLGMVWYPSVKVALFGALLDRGAEALTLASLCVLSMFGKRALEIQERRSFHTVTSERTLRVQTEFLLDQRVAGSDEDSRGRQISKASAPSVAGTVDTAHVFDQTRATCQSFEATLRRVEPAARREQWLIQPDEINIFTTEFLGRGGCGCVVAGSIRGLPVAVKIPVQPARAEQMEDAAMMITELRVMRKLKHPNIVTFYGAVLDSSLQAMALVLELVHGPDLQRCVEKLKVMLPQKDYDVAAYGLVGGVARALRYLHSHEPNIVHGDLKPANILIENAETKARSAKLVDFGLSRILSGEVLAMGGTLRWVAPEALREGGHKPDPVVDVYSFGMVMQYTLSGREPFAGLFQKDIKDALISGDVEVPTLETSGDLDSLGEAMWPLVVECRHKEASHRPDMEKVCGELSRIANLPAFWTSLQSIAQLLWRWHMPVGDSPESYSQQSFGSDKISEAKPWAKAVSELRQRLQAQAGKPQQPTAPTAAQAQADRPAEPSQHSSLDACTPSSASAPGSNLGGELGGSSSGADPAECIPGCGEAAGGGTPEGGDGRRGEAGDGEGGSERPPHPLDEGHMAL